MNGRRFAGVTSWAIALTIAGAACSDRHPEAPAKPVPEGPASVETTPAEPATVTTVVEQVSSPATNSAVLVAAFHEAALEGRLEEVRNAVASGTDVHAVDEGKRTALMYASFNGHTMVVDALLRAGARVDDRDTMGRTSLMFASTGSFLPTVQLLVENGSEINAVDGGEHWSPLMFAAGEGQEDVVAYLLEQGADPTLRDTDNDSAASFAAQRGHGALARLLNEAETVFQKP